MYIDGIEYLKDWHKKRREDMEHVRRPKWSLSEFGTIHEQIEKFNSDAENAEWEGLIADRHKGDINKVMGVRAKIAWLCGCRMSCRRQNAADTEDRFRLPTMDQNRFSYLQHWTVWKGLEQQKQTLDRERKKKVTG